MDTRLADLAAGARGSLLELTAALVAERSDNPPGDTRGPARVLSDYLLGQGLEPATLAARPDKANLVLSIEGSGPGPHLVLNGHLDTIPAGDETGWSVPVHQLGRGDGRLTGLGIGNMKAGMAALATATVALAAIRDRWPGRITLTAVADETIFGPDGANWLLDSRPDLVGDALLCAEGPGFMNLAIAEKGLLWIAVSACAAPGQGMLAEAGAGAIPRLAQAIARLDALNQTRVTPPEEIAAVASHAGPHGLRLSVNCGRITGGAFISQRPTEATAEVDLRIPPGLSREAVEATVDGALAGVEGVSWRAIKGWSPNWTPPEAAICRAVSNAAAGVRGRHPLPVVRLPASDAARWRRLGVPAVCFGPQPVWATGVDDYVLERDVTDCAEIYAQAALSFLTGATA